jgi:catechol 2,3-dioxygenase-like lactoylglutathione lyase family enzyme
MPSPTIDIWHVAFAVADLDRSIAFYCDGLGFELVGRDAEQAFVRLGERGFTLEFQNQPETAATARRAPDHVAFESADLDGYRDRLLAAGLDAPEVEIIGDGLKRFSLDDPDGVRLDFFQGRAGFEAFIAGGSTG